MSWPSLGRFGYGAANLGNLYRAMSDEHARQILESAWTAGVRYFDTAPHYGLGLSERRLGEFLATKPRHEFVVSTKVGRLLRPDPHGTGLTDDENDFVVPADQVRVWDVSQDGVRRSLEDSLGRLGLDTVDVLYLHDPERYDLDRSLREGLPALAGLREHGMVSAIGVASMATDALLCSARSGLVDLLMVAGRFTLADQSAAEHVLPACQEHGVGVVAAAVFNAGLLASPTPGTDSVCDYGPVPDDVLSRARRIAEVCNDAGVSLPMAALHYPLKDPRVQCVVVGGATPAQVEQNTRSLATDVPDELWLRLREEGLVSR